MDNARGDCWNTPQSYLDLLAELWLDGIDLDPCSNPTSLVQARTKVFESGNGLAPHWWDNAETAFVNPPWSKPGPWYERAYKWIHNDREAVVLTHVATGSKWWREWVWGKAAAVCFHSPRISFLDVEGKPIKGNPRDCATTYYGPRNIKFADVFSKAGHIIYAP